jgi:hypothetical protein
MSATVVVEKAVTERLARRPPERAALAALGVVVADATCGDA